MAEMLARIKSGNVHLRKIEAATSVSQQWFQYSFYQQCVIFIGEEET